MKKETIKADYYCSTCKQYIIREYEKYKYIDRRVTHKKCGNKAVLVEEKK